MGSWRGALLAIGMIACSPGSAGWHREGRSWLGLSGHRHGVGARAAARSRDAEADVVEWARRGYSELAARLIAALSRDLLECVICMGGITTRQRLWTCSRCHCILHAECAREWARAAAAQALQRPEGSHLVWTCALCHEPQSVIPSRTSAEGCWCGSTRLDATRRRSAANSTIPRSCLGTCSRPLYPQAAERPSSTGVEAGGGGRGVNSEGSQWGECGHTCQLKCHPVPTRIAPLARARSRAHMRCAHAHMPNACTHAHTPAIVLLFVRCCQGPCPPCDAACEVGYRASESVENPLSVL